MNDETKGQTPASAQARRVTAPGEEPATLTARVLARIGGTAPDEVEDVADELHALSRTAMRHPLRAIGQLLREANLVVRESLEKRDAS